MAILRILQYPDPRLRTQAKQVTEFNAELQSVIDDMFETHYAAENCAALAATQLDIKNPFSITVIDFSAQKNEPLCLINPVIISKSGEMEEEEGCMSVGSVRGSIYAKVKRASKIRVKALDRNGKTVEFDAEDYMAKCIQHEIDHLHGKIFLDHLSSLKRERLEKKLQKLRQE